MQHSILSQSAISMIRSDLFRYAGDVSLRAFAYHYFASPGFTYSVYFRLFSAYARDGVLAPGRRGLSGVARKAAFLWLRRYQFRFGIDIPLETEIGPGLFIGHFGSIVINADSTLGANCNISQGVTIGKVPRGGHVGEPKIGSNVYIGPGAKIIGGVCIGDGAAIGANAVVNRDVPPGVSVAGIPAEIVGTEGSVGYVNRRIRT